MNNSVQRNNGGIPEKEIHREDDKKAKSGAPYVLDNDPKAILNLTRA